MGIVLAGGTRACAKEAKPDADTLISIARDNEQLRGEYPVPEAFSTAKHVDAQGLRIDYSYRTHFESEPENNLGAERCQGHIREYLPGGSDPDTVSPQEWMGQTIPTSSLCPASKMLPYRRLLSGSGVTETIWLMRRRRPQISGVARRLASPSHAPTGQ